MEQADIIGIENFLKKEKKKTIAKDPPGLGHKDITRPDNQNLHTNY
jgi:hypothetical protein